MNRLEWILGIILMVLLLVVAVLSLTFWFRNDRTAVSVPAAKSNTVFEQADVIAPTSVYDGRSAIIAYAAAQKTAVAWQPDAQLLNAQATWPQGTTANQLRQGETSWGFTFYAPSAQQIAVISVVEDEATLISQGDHQQTDPLLSASGWNLDSQDAIETFLAGGGSTFLAEGGVSTLTMALLASDVEGNGRLEWQLSLFSFQTGQAFTMRLDATSGDILSTNPET
jgi:hypothetical protein